MHCVLALAGEFNGINLLNVKKLLIPSSIRQLHVGCFESEFSVASGHVNIGCWVPH